MGVPSITIESVYIQSWIVQKYTRLLVFWIFPWYPWIPRIFRAEQSRDKEFSVLWFSKDLNWLVDCLKVVSRYSFNCYDFLWCNSSIQRCRYLCLERDINYFFEYKTVLYGHLAPWKISLCNTKSTLLFGRLQASVITVMEILGVSGEIQ